MTLQTIFHTMDIYEFKIKLLYTGEKITTTTPGYRVKDIRIEVAIKNQLFTPYTNAEGYTCKLYYNIQYKGRFGEDWRYWITEFEQTDSQYTTLSQINSAERYAPGDQLDFRVEAITGPKVMSFPDRLLPFQHVEVEASSGWSKVQTFTMPSESSSSPSQTVAPTQNPTASPDSNQPQLPDQIQPPSFVFHPSFLLWIGALIFAGIAIAVVVMFAQKHLKLQTTTNTLPNQ